MWVSVMCHAVPAASNGRLKTAHEASWSIIASWAKTSTENDHTIAQFVARPTRSIKMIERCEICKAKAIIKLKKSKKLFAATLQDERKVKTEALYNEDIKIYVLKTRGVLYHRHVLIKRRACTLLQVWNSSPFIFSNVNQISAEEESFKIEIF